MKINIRYIGKGIIIDFVVGLLLCALGGLGVPNPIPLIREKLRIVSIFPQSISEDLLILVFLLGVGMTILGTLSVRLELLGGRIDPPEWYSHQIPFLKRLPDNLLVRSLVIGALSIIIFIPITYLFLGALQITSIPYWNYIVFRGLYGAFILPFIGIIVRLDALGGE
ncbi:MAG: hypothetical protein GF329_04930 [Candidatus Lokiarchaeota archaeon]|nr:hypothetical protein [Candidatus Lokiarchaeota archaeon]